MASLRRVELLEAANNQSNDGGGTSLEGVARFNGHEVLYQVES